MITEYDYDAYKRKWLNTYTLIKGVPYYIREIHSDCEVMYGIRLPYTLDSETEKLPAEVEYVHIKSGWYSPLKFDKPYCITRKFYKAFRAGVSKETHYINHYNPEKDRLVEIDTLVYANLADRGTVETDAWQIYKRRFLCTPTNIYYLNTKIGFISRGKVQLLYKDLHQEVSDALRESSCLKI